MRKSEKNALLPLSEQFPYQVPVARPFKPAEQYPGVMDTDFEVLVCDRRKYPDLADAERYFRRIRWQGEPWKYQSPVFKTARFWCVKIKPKRGLKNV